MAYPTTCLGNVIALQGGCDPVVPPTGYYLKAIGISNDDISQYITKEYASNLEFFNEKKFLAIEQITNALHSSFQPHYKANSLLKNFRVGHANDNKVLVAGNTGLKGIKYDFCDTDSYYDLFVNEISLFVNVSATISINVYDLIQGKLIDTIDIDTAAGEITKVYPSKTYTSSQRKLSLFFGYDSTGVSSYKTTLQAGGCTNCSGSYSLNHMYHTIQSGYINNSVKTEENFVSLSETGGLSINHSLQCNHRDWLCSISGLIALPILYKTAANIMEFALHSAPNSRTNTAVNLNKDLIKERLDLYEMKWREALDNIIKNAKVPTDSKCFECVKTFNYSSFAI